MIHGPRGGRFYFPRAVYDREPPHPLIFDAPVIWGLVKLEFSQFDPLLGNWREVTIEIVYCIKLVLSLNFFRSLVNVAKDIFADGRCFDPFDLIYMSRSQKDLYILCIIYFKFD